MWPWEHLAFGYILYSGYTRLRYGRPPEHYPVIFLAVATQFPDLVDKPLAWGFDVLPTARSFGHSVFVAVGVVAVVALIARWRKVPAVGTAVAFGYLSHLLGDVLYSIVVGPRVNVAYLFWPLLDQSIRETPGLLERTVRLLDKFGTFLGSPLGKAYITFELVLIFAVFVLWILDGRPGLRFS